METKTCTKCNTEHPISNFYVKRYMSSGIEYNHPDHRCKPCFKSETLTRAYLNRGFKSLRTNYCECCGVTEDMSKIVIDHDHSSGNFRGFVCSSCNRKLGALGDSYDSIMSSDCDLTYKNYIKMARLRSGKGFKS